MKLKNIELENIRSYTSEKIDLPEGITLFEGDIGCGKSTILYAIEFALFGLGDLHANYLMRHGTNKSSVRLVIEVDGKDYTIERTIEKKGKSTSQGQCSIIYDGKKIDYSPAEMKPFILDLLGFNENPNTKATSVIYRYAVFTPQEMMKEVLFQNSDKRLETLRRAFGVEDYRIARNNVEVLKNHLKEEISFIHGQTQDLDKMKSNLTTEKQKLKKFKKSLETFESNFNTVDKQLKELKDKIKEMGKKKEAVLELKSEISHLEEKIEKGEENVKLLEADIKKLEKDKKDSEEAEKNLEKMKSGYEDCVRISKEVERLESLVNQYQNLKTEKGKMDVAILKAEENLKKSIEKDEDEVKELQDEVEEIKPDLDKISGLKADAKALDKKLKQLPSISKQLTKLRLQESRIKTKIDGIKDEIKVKKDEWKDVETIGEGASCPRCHQKLTKEHLKEVEKEYNSEIDELEKKISVLEKDVPEIERNIKSLEKEENSIEGEKKKFTKLTKLITTLEQKKKTIKEEERKISLKLKSIEKDRKNLKNNNYALDDRKELAKVLENMKKIEPEQKKFEEFNSKLKEYKKSEIERIYTENKQTAGLKKGILEQLKDKEKRVQDFIKETETDKANYNSNKEKFEKEKIVLEDIEKLESGKEIVEADWKLKNSEFAGKKAESGGQEEKVAQLTKEILEKDKLLSKLDLYQQYKRWFDEYFIPVLELIEQHIMAHFNEHFNTLFQKWFNMLMESPDIDISVNEEFTPEIKQNGYDTDMDALSGGEKTSLALSYRLALNILVKEECCLKKSNLLILDEPTDGFSKEQLFKLRDVLDELKSNQVILVSHERELENFANKVYRIRKVNNVSQIEKS